MAFPNRYPGTCNNPSCKKQVAILQGFVTKGADNKWLTWCGDCLPERRKVLASRRLTASGQIFLLPGENDSMALVKSLKGPNGSLYSKFDVQNKCWMVSLDLGDRTRLLEVADRLKLDVAPELRNFVLSEAAQNAMNSGLYEFQVTGTNWLSQRKKALLGDDMGLGKTVQTLMALPLVGAKALVVAPAGLKYNWANEIKKWRKDLIVTVINGKDSFRFPVVGEVIIMNYDILPEWLDPNPAPVRVKNGKNVKGKRSKMTYAALKEWREKLVVAHPQAQNVVLIADEAHKLKNYKAARSVKFRELSRLCSKSNGKVWALTGTPFDNKAQDLYGTLDSCDMAFDVFTPMKGQTPFKRFQELFNAYHDRFGTKYGMPEPIVPELLRRVMLRRKRIEVLPNLPRKTFTNLVVGEMDAKLKKQLDEMWEAEGAELEVKDQLPPFEKFSEIRSKLAKNNIPAMLEYVEECEEQEVPLVVFSAHLAPIDALLGRPGWAVISGATTPENRQQIVDAFQAGKLKGVALTIRAGGVGLTLTHAWKALFVDLDWVPGWNAQAEDRVCRIGQNSSKVEVVRMVNDHPLTLHVLKLLATKIALIEAAVEKEMVIKTPTQQPGFEKGEESIAEFEARMARIQLANEDLAYKEQVASQAEIKAKAKSKVDLIHSREKARVTRQLPPLTADRKELVRKAFQYLLSVCDGAVEKDGAGFNKPDAVIAHCLLTAGLETEKEVEAGHYITSRYYRQLNDKFSALFS